MLVATPHSLAMGLSFRANFKRKFAFELTKQKHNALNKTKRQV